MDCELVCFLKNKFPFIICILYNFIIDIVYVIVSKGMKLVE